MKKIIKCTSAILLMFALLISSFGCSAGKYVFVVSCAGDTVKQAGARAVEIVDSYLSFKVEKDEMKAELASISKRLGDYTGYDNEPERIVVRNIEFLSEFSHMDSDDEITEMRDIIAVNCGMKETGRIFDMKKTSEFEQEYAEYLVGMEDDKEKVIEKYNIDTAGMSYFGSFKGSDGTVLVDATFDFSCGYSPEAVSRFFTALQSEEKGAPTANAYIEYYEQSVAYISMSKASFLLRWVGREDDNGMQSFDTVDEVLKELSLLEIKR